MSHEFIDHATAKDYNPSPAVQQEATRIIDELDGVRGTTRGNQEYDSGRAQTVRQWLLDDIKDIKRFSPQDISDLLQNIMDREDKKRGYDLTIGEHTPEQYAAKQKEIDQERQSLSMTELHRTPEHRLAAFKEFNDRTKLEMESYHNESVIRLTHTPAPAEYDDKPRGQGDPIDVQAYGTKNNLPDFSLVDKSEK